MPFITRPGALWDRLPLSTPARLRPKPTRFAPRSTRSPPSSYSAAVIDARGFPGSTGASMTCAAGTTPWNNGTTYLNSRQRSCFRPREERTRHRLSSPLPGYWGAGPGFRGVPHPCPRSLRTGWGCSHIAAGLFGDAHLKGEQSPALSHRTREGRGSLLVYLHNTHPRWTPAQDEGNIAEGRAASAFPVP